MATMFCSEKKKFKLLKKKNIFVTFFVYIQGVEWSKSAFSIEMLWSAYFADKQRITQNTEMYR